MVLGFTQWETVFFLFLVHSIGFASLQIITLQITHSKHFFYDAHLNEKLPAGK